MIHQIWLTVILVSVIYACAFGKGAQVLPSALAGCEKALALTLELCAGYLLFCGLMEIARALQAHRLIGQCLRPVLSRLMPAVRRNDTRDAVALNLSMNVLGLGNAATPAGLEAMRCMEAERALNPAIRHDMHMFLILNATGLQLLPTTVLTLRTAAGSAQVTMSKPRV